MLIPKRNFLSSSIIISNSIPYIIPMRGRLPEMYRSCTLFFLFIALVNKARRSEVSLIRSHWSNIESLTSRPCKSRLRNKCKFHRTSGIRTSLKPSDLDCRYPLLLCTYHCAFLKDQKKIRRY